MTALTPFFAALASAAPHAAEQQLLDIDATVFLMLGLFLLMMFLLTQLLWKPYLKVRHEREIRVDGYKAQAEKLDADAQQKLAKVDTELAAARKEGAAELATARKEAKIREQVLTAQAQGEASKDLAAAKETLDAALKTQLQSLHSRAQKLGQEAAGKVLGRAVS